MEELVYQYQRNMRDYQSNMRQMSNQLYEVATTRSLPPRYSVSFEMMHHQTGGLSEVDLQQRLRMSQYSADLPTTTCPISLERFQAGDDICEIVGCGHVFKRDPALVWLRRTPVCPVCRYSLTDAADGGGLGPLGAMFQNLMQNLAQELSDSPVD